MQRATLCRVVFFQYRPLRFMCDPSHGGEWWSTHEGTQTSPITIGYLFIEAGSEPVGDERRNESFGY